MAVGSGTSGLDPTGTIVVAGAGGFIGGHLVGRLLAEGHTAVRAVDIRPVDEWYQAWDGAAASVVDLRRPDDAARALSGARYVVNLASDMGGIGFIEGNRARCMENVLINTQLLMAAPAAGVERYFFSSSACVYPVTLQDRPGAPGLREEDAYPALPEDGYGWEKLFGERLCRHYLEERGLKTRVARYHNVFGPHGAWRGGREKAPAAICRKVAEAVLSGTGEIEIWGDGRQTRTFTDIDDCITGTLLLLGSDCPGPLNIGSAEVVTINQLVSMVEDIAGVTLERRYRPTAPTGVRGRSSDNTRIRQQLGWEPTASLRQGLEATYAWVHDRVAAELAVR